MPTARFLGHACVSVTDGKHNLIIDPFLTHNPIAVIKPEDVKADYVLLTHGHGDHFGDTEQIAKSNDATVIASFELGELCLNKGLKVHQMHIGGAHEFDFGRVKTTIAHHGGGFDGEGGMVYSGPPLGYLITIAGKTLYHSGDTGLFYDMKLIGEINQIDLAFIPIGDNFTMGIDDAVKAVEFLKPKKVVPIHYDTFDLIAQDPKEFASKVKGSEVRILKPGDSIEY